MKWLAMLVPGGKWARLVIGGIKVWTRVKPFKRWRAANSAAIKTPANVVSRFYAYTYISSLDGKEIEGPPLIGAAIIDVGDNQLLQGRPHVLQPGPQHPVVRHPGVLRTGYRPQHFALYELVPPEVFHLRGEEAWELFDPNALLMLDELWDAFGTCIVNDWHWGGHYELSGFREPMCEVGAVLSQHKFGRAFDCKFKRVTPQEAYAHILDNPGSFSHLTTLEDIAYTPTWLHADSRNRMTPGIRVVKP